MEPDELTVGSFKGKDLKIYTVHSVYSTSLTVISNLNTLMTP